MFILGQSWPLLKRYQDFEEEFSERQETNERKIPPETKQDSYLAIMPTVVVVANLRPEEKLQNFRNGFQIETANCEAWAQIYCLVHSLSTGSISLMRTTDDG